MATEAPPKTANDGQEGKGQNVAAAAEVDPIKKAKKDAKAAEKAAKKQKALEKEAARLKEAAEKSQNGSSSKSKKAATKDAKAREEAELEGQIMAVQGTSKGTKKTYGSLEDMPKGYAPKFVEAATYSWWEESGFFKPSMDSTSDNFVIVLPPPNVTGSLHLGHALTGAIQDALTRWHRMSGRNALWLPGLDHASIATQSIVEKTLLKKGIRREDLGREGFLKEVHRWVDEYGGKICKQMRRLGTSCDWSRQAFTMDEQCSAAVQEAFLRMHKDGLIYRDVRLVNWDCILLTAVSDSEVDYEDIEPFAKIKVPGYAEPVEFGVLTSFAYKLEQPYKDPSGKQVDEIIVATTRPETMIGDTGIAVHPEDPRYKEVIGKFAVHPLSHRRIPVVADAELVEMEFGTGAVKITPAHDPNDFDTGKRHDLEFINILTDDGRINHLGGQFEGLGRFQARVTVVDWLKELGLFRGTEGNKMRLGKCSRSGDVIEPVIKPQWWVKCEKLGADARKAVEDKQLEILPKPTQYLLWLSNLRDWCISRQLWWGHRIPAFYYTLEEENEAKPGTPDERTDHWVVAGSETEARRLIEESHPNRKIARIEQDVDVLDTWFSSGLFPFSTMGWPKKTADLENFYPTSLLETGNDIIFFWVIRMVMMGIHLTGKVPFKTVYLHNMVRDAHGRKMSKSLGNVIDPIDVIEGITLDQLHAKLKEGNLAAGEVERATADQKANFPEGIKECGTDALRLTLLQYQQQGHDLNLDIKRVVANRHWCNKLWNAIRFALLNLGPDFLPSKGFPSECSSLPKACQWVLSKLAFAISSTIESFATYKFGAVIQSLYAFWQYEVCDVFIELVKPILQQKDSSPAAEAEKTAYRETLWLCLDAGLRLIHPVMPFVTEELWQRLPKGGGPQPESIMLASYPTPQQQWRSSALEEEFDHLLEIVRAIRKLRTDHGLTRERPQVYVKNQDKQQLQWLESGGCQTIAALSSSDTVLTIEPPAEIAPRLVKLADNGNVLMLLPEASNGAKQ